MQREELNLKLNNFDGPLDLLLSLVKDKHMDVLEIDLAELATEYLKMIEVLKDQDIDLASEYLVMAATLLQLKAKMLLERPDQKEEVKKEKEDILRQLAEYQQFKKISSELRSKEELRKGIYIKTASDYTPYAYQVDESKLDGKSDAIKLIIALRKMFERVNASKLRETTIEKFNLSPADRRIELIKLFKTKQEVTFEDIFSVPSMNHFVVTMLTILDMSRRQELILTQDEQFGEIRIMKGQIDE